MDKQETGPPRVDPSLWLDEHGDYLFRFALSRLRDGDVAEEVVQDTFVRRSKTSGSFPGEAASEPGCWGILKNKIIDVYRKRKRDPINVDGDNADISEMLFDQNGSWKKEIRPTLKQSLDSVDREEFWAILQKCLGLLPRRQADAFTLRTMDEQSTENICQELEITPTNYWVILHRARLQLSGCMKQQWFGGEKS